ncbi:hypothetical protein EI94DRAFT_1703543 [Lactarius quietus]|nr:hypothetical protein EI94DRAFT_1703543 [Lactarius quietus]
MTQAVTTINNSDEVAPQGEKGAADIHYFFKEEGGFRVCVLCLEKKGLDPDWVPPHYQYLKGNSITTLRSHLKRIHSIVHETTKKEKGWAFKLQGSGTTNAISVPQSEECNKFTGAKFHERLVNFIISDDQSICVIECPKFRSLLLLL